MSLVFCWDSTNWCGRNFLQMEDNPSNIVLAQSSCPWDIHLSRNKGSFFCVIGLEYYGKLGVVDPSMFPIYFWLCGCKPWIPHDCLFLSCFSEIKGEFVVVGPVFNRGMR